MCHICTNSSNLFSAIEHLLQLRTIASEALHSADVPDPTPQMEAVRRCVRPNLSNSRFNLFCVPLTRCSWLLKIEPKASCQVLIQAFQLSVMCIMVSIIITITIIATIMIIIIIIIIIIIMTFTPSFIHFFTEKLLALAPDAFRAPRLFGCSGGTLPFKQTCQPRTRHIKQRAVPKLLIPCQYCRMFRIMSSQTCSSHHPALHLIQPPLLAGVLPAWNSSKQPRVEEFNDFKPHQHDRPSHKKGYST